MPRDDTFGRQQALLRAELNGQLKVPENIRCGKLFSEDVW